jgi:hypothetical protein
MILLSPSCSEAGFHVLNSQHKPTKSSVIALLADKDLAPRGVKNQHLKAPKLEHLSQDMSESIFRPWSELWVSEMPRWLIKLMYSTVPVTMLGPVQPIFAENEMAVPGSLTTTWPVLPGPGLPSWQAPQEEGVKAFQPICCWKQLESHPGIFLWATKPGQLPSHIYIAG